MWLPSAAIIFSKRDLNLKEALATSAGSTAIQNTCVNIRVDPLSCLEKVGNQDVALVGDDPKGHDGGRVL